MRLGSYFDQHVPAAITRASRLRGVDVLAARDDKHDRAGDNELLERATELKRILFTQDEDLPALAHQYQLEGQLFAGVVYSHQLRVSVGRCVNDLKSSPKRLSQMKCSIAWNSCRFKCAPGAATSER